MLNVVRSLTKSRRQKPGARSEEEKEPEFVRAEFTLAEVYAQEAVLAQPHPGNLHVRDKIRQQLQVLRGLGFVEFLGRGNYRVSGLGFRDSQIGYRC